MEHRWGHRKPAYFVIRIQRHAQETAFGRLINVSVSGALVVTLERPPLWSRVEVVFDCNAHDDPPLEPIAAYVVRHTSEGIGLEWCEFVPGTALHLLAAPANRAQGNTTAMY